MSKGGAVTAEQLAPYLDVQLADLERVDGEVNESFVVSCPALVAAPPAMQGAFQSDKPSEWGCSLSLSVSYDAHSGPPALYPRLWCTE